MGTWGVSVSANDLAQDLKDEYRAAFFYNDVPTALEKIDAYVRREIGDETDEDQWADYIYSLADFMWKKGILTTERKSKALEMISTGYGLEIWAESGDKVLAARKAALRKFEEQLIDSMPEKKRITMDVNMDRIFKPGDIVAFKLLTEGKEYYTSWIKEFPQDTFIKCHGKYVVCQLIEHYPSWKSSVEPKVSDNWCIFRLFDKVFDSLPKVEDIFQLPDADFLIYNRLHTPYFSCESKMYYFKKRGYVLLGNDLEGVDQYKQNEDIRSESLYFKSPTIDSFLLSAMSNIE